MNVWPLCLCLTLSGAPPLYEPDLSQWRMEVSPGLGGWSGEDKVILKVKIVDPRDPAPPREGGEHQEVDRWWEGATPEIRRAKFEAHRRAQEEEERRNRWRERTLRIWFNGSERTTSITVGREAEETLECQNGENRLELQEPASGLRVVRTWWAFAGRTRLQISQLRGPQDGWGGNLEVLEPNGDLAGNMRKTPSGGVAGWNTYTHASPPAGTYTLRWTALPRYGSPCTVVVEALLDAGTERERRWRFTRLMLPGAGPATLGTLDVEP